VAVRVTGPDGKPLGETRTDQAGEFSFEAKWRCDHHLTADSGDGHVASFVVRAAELPSDLPACPGAGAPAPAVHPFAVTQPADATAVGADEAKLREMIEAAVAQRVGALQRQVQAYEDRVRFSDVVGGIGYVVGFAGLAFFWLGRRQKQLSSPPPKLGE
jgi:nickel transport protein